MALRRRGDNSRVRAGELRERVTVYGYTLTSDSQGGRTAAENEIKKSWAKVEPLSVTRTEDLGLTVANKAHTVIMRYDPDVTLDNDSYLVTEDGSRKLYFHQVLNLNKRDRILEILAVEKK